MASQLQPSLSARVVASWLATQEPGTGYIAREQILGPEARSRVPSEFQTQRRDVANPPTLLLPVLTLAVDGLCGRLGGAVEPASDSSADSESTEVSVGADGSVSTHPSSSSPSSSSSRGGVDVSELSPAQAARVARFCAAHVVREGSSSNNNTCVYACRRPSQSSAAAAGSLPDGGASDSFLSPAETLAMLREAYPRLRRLYRWFLFTQAGGDAWAAKQVATPTPPPTLAAARGADAGAAASSAGASRGLFGKVRRWLGLSSGVGGDASSAAAAYDEGLEPEDEEDEFDEDVRPGAAAPAVPRGGAQDRRKAGSAGGGGIPGIDGPLPLQPPPSFRWRGATSGHNFASGLDDYPRGVAPHVTDENVDLLAWMGMAARVLGELAGLVADEVRDGNGTAGAPPSSSVPGSAHDEATLSYHSEVYRATLSAYWSDSERAFCDYGVTAYAPPPPGAPASRARYSHGLVCHKGYVSILPLALRLVDPSSPAVGAALEMMGDEAQMWSPHGLRSLSAADPFYRTGACARLTTGASSYQRVALYSLPRSAPATSPHANSHLLPSLSPSIPCRRGLLALCGMGEHQLPGCGGTHTVLWRGPGTVCRPRVGAGSPAERCSGGKRLTGVCPYGLPVGELSRLRRHGPRHAPLHRVDSTHRSHGRGEVPLLSTDDHECRRALRGS